jgi:methionine-rich copper-binding protein CopC
MRRQTLSLLVLLLAIVEGLQPSKVLAHSELVTAVPAPGAALATVPAEIRLTFSEPLATGSTFQLFGENFLPVSGISAAIDPESPEQLVAAVPSLLPGDYTVQWTSVADDGDILSGSYSFTLLAEAQKGTGALVWITAAAGGLALVIGLTWLYLGHRNAATKKIGEEIE